MIYNEKKPNTFTKIKIYTVKHCGLTDVLNLRYFPGLITKSIIFEAFVYSSRYMILLG